MRQLTSGRMALIYDNSGRPVLNFRISVTQRCNLRCPYCHHEGETAEKLTEMTPEEIGRITRIVVGFGVPNVKLTGGEPLIREDIIEIVGRINSIQGIKDLAMTTNGVLLSRKAEELKKNGLKRVNISFLSLDSKKYHNLTGGSLEDLLKGINKAITVGLYPIKLNMVVLRNVNDDEIDEIINFCRDMGVILQLIELEPLNVKLEYYSEHHEPLNIIEDKLARIAFEVGTRHYMQNRRIYYLPGVKVEVVNPLENSEFCNHCTRIRLTSDGKLKPCLMRNDNLVDILTPLRNGETDEYLAKLFVEAVKKREPYFRRNVIKGLV